MLMRWKEQAGNPVGREQKRGSQASPGIADVPESQSLAPVYWLDKGLSFGLLKISIKQLEEKSHDG